MNGWWSSFIGHLIISYYFENYYAEKTIKSGWISAVKAEQGPGYHRETIQVGVRLSTFRAVWHCRYQSTAWVPSARNAKQEPLFQVQRSTSPLLPPSSLILGWCWDLKSSVSCQLLLRPTLKCQALPFLSLSIGPTLFHPQCLLQLSFVCQQLSNFALQPRILFWAPALPLGCKISMPLCVGEYLV